MLSMEASSSCSSPLSVHSRRVDLVPPSFSRPRHRLVSAKFATPQPNCPFPITSSCSSNSSTYFGISISPNNSFHTLSLSSSRKKRSLPVIFAAFERFTERAIKAVMFSQREAKSLGNEMVFTQHVLLGLIAESRRSDGFLGSGITIDVACEAVRSIWNNEESNDQNSVKSEASLATSATDVPFSTGAKRVFEAAVEYSRTMGYNFIAPEHIAIGLFTVDDGNAGRVLERLGANVDHLATVAVSRLQGEVAKDGRELPAAPKRTRDKSFPSKSTAIRSSEITRVQRIIEILCRRTKNNPILLGEAGVGKTAIAEVLAISIAQANVPVFLLTKRIMSLDIGLLIAGAKERGELEGRVTTLINDVKKSGNVILFIDEVHTLIGSGKVGRGNKGSGLDIANLLKPSLGRGEVQIAFDLGFYQEMLQSGLLLYQIVAYSGFLDMFIQKKYL